MAGRIRDADVQLVRDRSRIDEVVGEYVQLRSAGGGSLKGLCPFHDEKSPSFNVRPAVGFYHCFGCQKGGDVISFVREIDNLSFQEAVERLARRAGITLTYEGGGATSRAVASQRQRLLDAHRVAAEFYSEALSSLPEARAGWDFLAARGFDKAVAEQFHLGYAPSGWDTLTRHLLARRFTAPELIAAGLAKEGSRGSPIDRFHRRLVWPIQDLAGDVVGFGARLLAEDDKGPKYLNTPETVLFKKSHLLYGATLARREIARRYRVVVVEGYTDVMACHLAGEQTAVATCGTAFGNDHVAVLRRLLMDSEMQRGEIIFTFDGDSAGQQAAMRAFDFEERFTTQTFVAVEPSGMDPCEVRVHRGDTALRDLVASRVPLFEFAIRSVLARYDLDTTEGRMRALDAAAPLVNQIRDRGLRHRYAVNLDRWLGFLDEAFVVRRVAEHRARGQQPGDGRPGPRPGPLPGGGAAGAGRSGAAGPVPRGAAPGGYRSAPDDVVAVVEREALKMALQYPGLAGPAFDRLGQEAFTVALHQAAHACIASAGGVCAGISAIGDVASWVGAVAAAAVDDDVRSLVAALAVEPALCDHDVDDRYVDEQLSRVQELHVARRITDLKSRVQRLNPVADPEAFKRAYGELIALEQHRRQLRERGVGAT